MSCRVRGGPAYIAKSSLVTGSRAAALRPPYLVHESAQTPYEISPRRGQLHASFVLDDGNDLLPRVERAPRVLVRDQSRSPSPGNERPERRKQSRTLLNNAAENSFPPAFAAPSPHHPHARARMQGGSSSASAQAHATRQCMSGSSHALHTSDFSTLRFCSSSPVWYCFSSPPHASHGPGRGRGPYGTQKSLELYELRGFALGLRSY